MHPVHLLLLGCQVHDLVARATSARNVFVNNSLLDIYSKCDCVGEMELFDKMSERDNVSYNVMIVGRAMLGAGAVAVQGDVDARFRQVGLALCYFAECCRLTASNWDCEADPLSWYSLVFLLRIIWAML